MAGDWIKMRCNIDRDPKVTEMACVLADDEDFCQWLGWPVRADIKHAFEYVTVTVTRDIVVSSLLRIWGVAAEQGKRASEDSDDLVLSSCNRFTIDEIAGVPGFAAAMEKVGWVETRDDNTAVFPNFLRDNVPADERKKARERASSRESSRRYREKSKENVTGDSDGDSHVTVTRDAKVTTREEKRREDIDSPNGESKNAPAARTKTSQRIAYPDGMDTAEVRQAVDDWAAYRRKRKFKPLLDESYEAELRNFAKTHGARAGPAFCEAVAFSQTKGWQGIFPPSGKSAPKSRVREACKHPDQQSEF